MIQSQPSWPGVESQTNIIPGLINSPVGKMMSVSHNCPKCQSEYTYADRNLMVCSQCAHEWSPSEVTAVVDDFIVKDAHGTVLKDGDSVTVIKDLKIKGASSVVKVGTKVKNIKLVDSDHNIDCKIDGIGQIGLKSEFVKKT